MLPRRKPKARSGIERAPQRDFPKHRAFIRRHCCVVTLGIVHDDCDGPIECAHVRVNGRGGVGLKPHDACTISACKRHHSEIHARGERSFEGRYGLSLSELAREFASKSPVEEVRKYYAGN